jgi:DNA ligase D-like protein (predicted ligase)
MLATLTSERVSDDGWVAEQKLDGVRCLAFRDGAEVRLLSRNQKAMSRTYPEVADALAAAPMSRFVVDGEIVAFDGPRTSFARLQGRLGVQDQRLARRSAVPVFYYVFDLLHLDGHDVTGLPLTDRKALLQESFDYADPLRFAAHHPGSHAADLFAAACARGDEGLVLKRAASSYRGGRSTDWRKLKCVRHQELVVGGWTDARGGRQGFGALLVGHYVGDDLVYAGRVGTGFDDATLTALTARLVGLASDRSPFAHGLVGESDVHWVEPQLVAQIGFSEWTGDGKLRHPRFQGLREDKSAADVVRET